jgi:hypothetical protein
VGSVAEPTLDCESYTRRRSLLAAEVGITQVDEGLWAWLPDAPSLEDVKHLQQTMTYLFWATVAVMLMTGQVYSPVVLAKAGLIERSIVYAIHLAERRRNRN